MFRELVAMVYAGHAARYQRSPLNALTRLVRSSSWTDARCFPVFVAGEQ